MRRSQRNIAGAIALGAISLWASGYAYAQDDTDADANAATDSETGARLHPPHLIDSLPPEFPAGRQGLGLHPTVILLVTITPDAKVTDIVVEHCAS